MKAGEARQLGDRLSEVIEDGDFDQALDRLLPILKERTPFRILGLIGEGVGTGSLEPVNHFLDRIAATKLEGAWVFIASALAQRLNRDLEGTLLRCKGYIILADVWFGADIFGERVPGPALLRAFEPSLSLLAAWRRDPNRWIRRTVGVAVHFWAKRSKGTSGLEPQAEALMRFLEPMFSEWDMDALKGVGWGLKTLGKRYPDLMTDWLKRQSMKRHRTLMLKKALTYLSDPQRAQVLGGRPP